MYLYINDSVMDWNDELFQAPTPSPPPPHPHAVFVQLFSIRFPYYIGAWDMDNTVEPRSTNTCR